MLPASDIKAVEMVASIKPLVLLDDLRQDASRAISQLKKGEVYPAKLLEITDKGDARVSIGGHQLKLNLQAQLAVGDTLMLKYLGDSPSPSFKLLSKEPPTSPEVRISQTAMDIAEQVSQADQKGTSRIYQAAIPATTTPNNVNQFAADLQHTLSTTGLFYESHLADFTQGTRTLASVMQEPQNQGTVAPHQLIAQQLNVLETQRFLWHGEIWPGQLAYWQVEADTQRQDESKREPAEPVVSSDLSLELPNLGNITARIKLVGGKLNVTILAEESDTVGNLQNQASQLVESLQRHVAKLEGISIQRGAKPDA